MAQWVDVLRGTSVQELWDANESATREFGGANGASGASVCGTGVSCAFCRECGGKGFVRDYDFSYNASGLRMVGIRVEAR